MEVQSTNNETSPVLETNTAADSAANSVPAEKIASGIEKTSTEVAVNAAQTGDLAAQTQQYTPNFKFKVLDKEHEIEERFRKLIKDADSEKMIRELHEKSFGIEAIKSQRD